MNEDALKKLKSKEKQLRVAEYLLLSAVILMTAAHTFLFLSTKQFSYEQLFPLLFVFIYFSTRKMRGRIKEEIKRQELP